MTTPNSYQTVLFDLDGTLVDNFQAIFLAWEECRKEFNIPEVPFQQVKDCVGGSALKTMTRLTNPELAKEVLPRYRVHYENLMMEGIFILPGVHQLLVHLQEKNISAAVYTNKYGVYARKICDHLDITKYFVEVLGAEDTEWIKPEPKLTEHLLESLSKKGINIQKEKVLMVGDSPFDIATGCNANLDTAAIASGTHSVQQLSSNDPAPTAVFANMSDLHNAWF